MDKFDETRGQWTLETLLERIPKYIENGRGPMELVLRSMLVATYEEMILMHARIGHLHGALDTIQAEGDLRSVEISNVALIGREVYE